MRARRSICFVAAWLPVVALSIEACASHRPPAPPADINLKAAASYLASDLNKQLSTSSRSRAIVVDPFLDRATGQQTGVTTRVQAELTPALESAMTGVSVLPLDAKSLDQTNLVLTGNVAATGVQDRYAINVALTDRTSGIVIAQSAARFQQAGLDSSPTKFYEESPSLVRDRSTDGYLKTSETPAGSLADALYVAQLPTAALIAAASDAYNAGRWEEALAGYSAAAARTEGQTLRTFNGLYLCNLHLGRTAAAEESFSKIAALGLATNNLAVKLLFRPGTTDFVADPSFSGVYPMWLRQIGRALRASDSCLHIVGHTSKSGSEATNDRLSLARAVTVRGLLDSEAPGLERRTRVSGMGFRKNLVGSGTDDARDALDRRVEFEVERCSIGPS